MPIYQYPRPTAGETRAATGYVASSPRIRQESKLEGDLTLASQGIRFEGSLGVTRAKQGEILHTNTGDFVLVETMTANHQGRVRRDVLVADIGTGGLHVVGSSDAGAGRAIMQPRSETTSFSTTAANASGSVIDSTGPTVRAAAAGPSQADSEIVTSDYYSGRAALSAARDRAAAASYAASMTPPASPSTPPPVSYRQGTWSWPVYTPPTPTYTYTPPPPPAYVYTPPPAAQPVYEPEESIAGYVPPVAFGPAPSAWEEAANQGRGWGF